MSRRVIVLGLAAAVTMAVMPARGGAALGTCVANVHFNFASPISNTAGPTTYSMNGSGTCQTSAQPAAAKTFEFLTTTGQVTSGRCAALTMQGPYVGIFFPDPAPSGSVGQSSFVGTAAGGAWLWTGSNPTFVGVGILASGGMVSCVNGGTNSLNFTMSFTFADP